MIVSLNFIENKHIEDTFTFFILLQHFNSSVKVGNTL